MRAALLLIDRQTAAELRTAIRRHREASHILGDEISDGLEDIAYALAEIANGAPSGQEQSGAVTVGAGRDPRVMPDWLTVDQAADMTGLSRATLRRRLRDGSLTSSAVGRSRRISRRALDEFMTAGAA